MPYVSHLDAEYYLLYIVIDMLWLQRLFWFFVWFFFLIGNPEITFKLHIWRSAMVHLQLCQLQGGKSLLTAKERMKSTKFYSYALFLACCSCQKPEHASDKMNTMEKENTKWIFFKNWVIFVWKVLRANVICTTIMPIIQKVLFLLVSSYVFQELRTFRTINVSAKWIVSCLYCLVIKISLPLQFSSTFTWENFKKRSKRKWGKQFYCRYTYLK